MKSFGIWYKKNKDAEKNKKPEIDLHVNFWSLEDIDNSEKVKDPYLDIGIQIKNYSILDNITLYCPVVLTEKSIEDLSPKFAAKNNANIIFNEECEVETNETYTVIKKEKNVQMLVFPFKQVVKNVFRIVWVEDQTDEKKIGTKLVFELKRFHEYIQAIDKLEPLDTIYIRFRIKDKSLKEQIYFDSEPMNKSFESAFSGTRIIDFKVNEKRNINDIIRVEVILEKNTWATLNSVHYLVMVPSSYDLNSFYEGPMTCRELEDDLWDNYLGTEIISSNSHVLAYHWRAKAKKTMEGEKLGIDSESKWGEEREVKKEIESFSCLVKVNYSRAKWSTIVAYAFSVIALGILGSLVVTLLSEPFEGVQLLWAGIGSILICFICTWIIGKKH